ncbi:MAG: glycosyltransferase family 4 protein [Planctomycetes bacterium]|nr:glycosyltransferase family 4 protein [Planctomycetota bacterium]
MPGERTIAHVFATFGAGGPQIRAVQLMARLGSGYRHVVMAMNGDTAAMAQLPAGLDVTCVEPPPRAGLLATARAQRRWLRGLRPDLTLTYNWGAIETALAARRLGLPLVHHEDGFGPEEIHRRFRRRNWMRRALLAGVPVIVPSAVLAGIAQREWGIRGERLALLPNGVDPARFRPSAEPGRTAAPTLGTVGGLRAEKDHATLLRAFAALPGSGPDAGAAPCLRLVGGGPLADELRALAEELGVAARVEFVGPVSDTAPEYRQLDLFVLSSRTEQMPIALLEAMASGCAVAATDVGDVGRILPAAQHPFVVARENPEALTGVLVPLLADAELRRRLGRSNRARVEECYELSACLDRFVAVYERALTSRCRT